MQGREEKDANYGMRLNGTGPTATGARCVCIIGRTQWRPRSAMAMLTADVDDELLAYYVFDVELRRKVRMCPVYRLCIAHACKQEKVVSQRHACSPRAGVQVRKESLGRTS